VAAISLTPDSDMQAGAQWSLLILTTGLVLGADHSEGAISLGLRGAGPLVFDAWPTLAEGWATLGVAGNSGDLMDRPGLDAAVQLRSIVDFTNGLAQSPTVNPVPAVNDLAR
jgi:hypothetical protein